MFKLSSLDRSSFWFFIVIATVVSFPWHERISSLGIILLCVHWLLDLNLLAKIKSFKLTWGVGFLWGFWLFHLVWIWFGIDYQDALHSIEVKLSFGLLPLLFSTENYFDRKKMKQLFLFFTVSCALSFLYTMSMAFYHHHHEGLAVVFHRMIISEAIMHPGYYANYFAFAIVFLTQSILTTKKILTTENLLFIVLVFFFSFIEIVLVSKTALIFLAIYAMYAIWILLAFLKNIFFRIALFIVCGFIAMMLASQVPQINRRIHETQKDVAIPNAQVLFSNSTKTRIVAWGLEWKAVKQNWLIGYGTGSANAILLKELKNNHYDDLVKYKMHTHNQILHTWLDLGLFGIILLFAWLVYFAVDALRSQKPYVLALIGLILINISTDDMLEIQAACVFFIFFLTLFSLQPATRKAIIIK
jgi:O-antigen ligase